MSAPTLSAHHHGSATGTRDYLYRALYLRRELLILTSRSQNERANEETDATATATATATASPSLIDLQDILLLPPLYGIDGLTTPPSPSTGEGRADPMLTAEHAWSGLVRIRAAASPWYRGCFSFYVYFPSRYPFEPPIIELSGPLRSHPLVQERRVLQLSRLGSAAAVVDPLSDLSSSARAGTNASTTVSTAVGKRVFIPFEDVYAAIDPMKVSVMAALLRHVLRVFYPAEWPPSWLGGAASNSAGGARSPATTSAAAAVNRVLARRDVERRSVTQEVVLTRPFEQYVDADVMQHFLELWDTCAGSEDGDVTGTEEGTAADWYTREVLPHLLHS